MADHDHDHDHANCDHDHDHDHDHGSGPDVATVVEDLGPCKKLLKVEVSSGDVKKEIETRLNHLRKNVHLKGFRRGKAPRSRVEKLYGEQVREDARSHLLRQGYLKALTESIGETRILGEGTIEAVNFSPEQGLKFEVTVHTRPEVALEEEQYKGIEVEVPAIRIEDGDVAGAIDDLRRSRGELGPVDAADAVVEGEDVLTCDVEVWLADEYETWAQAQEGGEATELKPLNTEHDLQVRLPLDRLGGYRVEDLVDSLTGLKRGEWGEVETELAPDYEVVEGRGEPAMLRVQVKSIQRIALPELDDEFAQQVGSDSVKDLQREVREQLQEQRDRLRQREVEEKALAALLGKVGEFELPADLVDKEVESAERRRMFELRIREGKSESEAEEAVREQADLIRADTERSVRYFFLLDEVARREEIEVGERDIQARIARLAAARGQSPAAILDELQRHDVIGQMHQEIMDEKARGFLREHARLVETD